MREENKMVDWNKLGNYEKHPNLSGLVPNVKDSVDFVFLSEEKPVEAALIQQAMKEAGKRGIRARDSIVWDVQAGGEVYSLWQSETSFTPLGQLKAIRDANNGRFTGARAKMIRVAKDDMTTASFKFEKA
jgi:hypothetical protein